MAPSLSDTGNMGPVWGGLILKNFKQNPAFWVSLELKIRPQIFINYIQHFNLASTTVALWFTVYNRINYHKATLMFRCINKLAPEYFKRSMFNSINENCPYGLRSTTSNNLQFPRPKSEYFKRTFLYSGTNLWNSLPSNTKV